MCSRGKPSWGHRDLHPGLRQSRQQPTPWHFLVDTVHCRTTTPAFPSSLANVCPWVGAGSPCISRWAIPAPWGHAGLARTWGQLLPGVLPDPSLCHLKQQTKRFLKSWPFPSFVLNTLCQERCCSRGCPGRLSQRWSRHWAGTGGQGCPRRPWQGRRGAGGFTATPNLLWGTKPLSPDPQMLQEGELCLRAATPARGDCSRGAQPGQVGSDRRGHPARSPPSLPRSLHPPTPALFPGTGPGSAPRPPLAPRSGAAAGCTHSAYPAPQGSGRSGAAPRTARPPRGASSPPPGTNLGRR